MLTICLFFLKLSHLNSFKSLSFKVYFVIFVLICWLSMNSAKLAAEYYKRSSKHLATLYYNMKNSLVNYCLHSSFVVCIAISQRHRKNYHIDTEELVINLIRQFLMSWFPLLLPQLFIVPPSLQQHHHPTATFLSFKKLRNIFLANVNRFSYFIQYISN